MEKINVIILSSNHEEFIDLTIDSVLNFADRILVIGNPNKETRKRILKSKNRKVELHWRNWDGSYGKARNFGLGKIKQNEWILSLDADEVLNDYGFMVKEIINEKLKINNYNIEYIHFIRDFGHIDSTTEKHIGIKRLFKNKNVQYKTEVHELPFSPDFIETGMLKNIKIYHLGYLKGIDTITNKFKMNLNKSHIHSKEFLYKWKDMHLFGKYPVKEIEADNIHSRIIKKAFLLEEKI